MSLPSPATPSAEYSVSLNGQPLFVHTLPGFAGGSVSWITCTFPENDAVPLRLSITAHRCVDKVAVHPRQRGIPARLTGSTAEVVLAQPGHYFLKWDDSFQLPLYLFVQPAPIVPPADQPRYIGPDAPEIGGWAMQHAPSVISFGPGVHQPGQIRLQSGQTLYLAAGAEVYATVIAENASDIRICGQGMLRGTHIAHGGTSAEKYMISLRNCRRVVVEGVTLADGFHWNINAHHCDHVVFRWIQILSDRLFSTDGINPCASRDVLIEDCFMRTKDDCVAVKGLDWEYPDPRDWSPMRDIVVRRCVLWSDNNNCLVVGSETRASVIERVTFEDCDILTVSNTCGDIAGALTVIALDDTQIRDITFRRIRVEFAHGPLFNVRFTKPIFGIPDRRLGAGGRIERVTFEDIALLEGPARRSFIVGLDSLRRIGLVTLRHISLRGQPVRDLAELRLVTNDHADPVQLMCAVKPDGVAPAARSAAPEHVLAAG